MATKTPSLLALARGTLILLTLLAAAPAWAWTVTVAWDPNPPSENVTGYVLHYGNASRMAPGFTAYAFQRNVGNVTQYTVDLPDPAAIYYFAVVAHNAGSQSGYSAEVSASPPPPAPAVFTIAASAGAGGSISPSGSVTVNQGASQTFTISPASGYRVANVFVNGTSVGTVTSYTFSNVTANHTIAASFEPIPTALTPPQGFRVMPLETPGR